MAPSPNDAERRIARPLEGLTQVQVTEKVQDFIRHTGIDSNDFPHLWRGAFLAASADSYRLRSDEQRAQQQHLAPGGEVPAGVLDQDGDVLVNKTEAAALRDEETSTDFGRSLTFFKRLRAYPRTVYMVILCCSLGAIVQGFDESAVNGAQVFYSRAFHINGTAPDTDSPRDTDEADTLLGLVNAAPYLLSAVACLFVSPLNRLLRGRRGVIFVTCFISSISCLGQSFTSSWRALFAVRLILGLGIGPKSATVPIYASECAPKSLRGGLVMMWQMWTAFGIMLGYLFGFAFWSIGGQDCLQSAKVSLPCSWNWRLMLAIPAIPPLIPMLYVFTLPESPRYLLQTAIRLQAKQKASQTSDLTAVAKCIKRAYRSLDRLNKTELQATRELFMIYHSLKVENEIHGYGSRGWLSRLRTSVSELISNNRSRHALYASVTVMFLQQFCGVNVLAYYSTTVIQNTLPPEQKLTSSSPYLYSLGFGIINFVCAFPAVPLMDLWGRRRLLLSTFPILAVCQFAMAAVPDNSTGGMVAAMYVFCAFYSAAEGPIPFVYSSESFPLHHRDMAMGIVTSVTWIFNFTLAVTWPLFLSTFDKVGAFSWYGTWCVIGWFMIFFLVRETKGLGLEQMGEVFSPPLRVYASFAWEELQWFMLWPSIMRDQGRSTFRPPQLRDNRRYREWRTKLDLDNQEEHQLQDRGT